MLKELVQPMETTEIRGSQPEAIVAPRRANDAAKQSAGKPNRNASTRNTPTGSRVWRPRWFW